MNYRDLQNISNLSQQILIEGANEEHNVLNRWPYTSPYLQEDYNQEDYKPWDFGPKQNAQAKHTELAQRKKEEVASGQRGGSGTATRANRIASVARDMRTTLDKDSAVTMTNPNKQGLQPSTPRHTAAAVRGAGGGTTARTKFDVKPLKPASKGGGSSVQGLGSSSGTRGYQVGGGQGYGISGIKLADSYEYDLYDIILSHLLDEGYAETQEQAEVIMVNMSEEWRESICEELTGERKKRALEKGGYLANRVASGKEGQPLERINRSGDVTVRTTKKGPTKRGGMGFKGKTKSDWYGTDDAHGYANKSRRRRGIEVKDTSDEL